MPDVFSNTKRSEVMALIRGKGNLTTELRLIKLMRASGITGWRRGSKLPGRPDFIFPQNRLAVFVDGDFWHGHPKRSRIPNSNRTFWEAKITGNKLRDRRNNRLFRSMGWNVLRIWEWSLKHHPVLSLTRLELALSKSAL